MFRSVLARVLIGFLLLASLSARPISPVQPIQSQGRTFCTVFSINEKLGYWGTAGHCAIYVWRHDLDGIVTILGSPATIVMIDTKADLAVFHADTNVPALKLAKQSVEPCNPVTVARKPCDVIFIQGFPYGLPKLVTVIGYLAARDVPILHPTYEIVMPSDILDITTAGGNSGSPVMNSKGEVIGVLWGGFIESPHSLAIPLESVRRALLGYFEN